MTFVIEPADKNLNPTTAPNLHTGFETLQKHGLADAKSILPDKNTVKRKVEKPAETVRKILIKEVKDASPENRFIGTTTDTWIMD